jgi:anaerobic selenocysteine-containing dehydrogenase
LRFAAYDLECKLRASFGANLGSGPNPQRTISGYTYSAQACDTQRVVVIDPRQSVTASKAEVDSIKPGTDAALALGNECHHQSVCEWTCQNYYFL